jgi:glycogen(starch) synthase
VEEIYAMSDLYVMPSISEPFGITPFEAIKYDVPVIVSKQSGIAEVLPNASKVDFWDVEQLAAEIERVLFEPGVAESMRASHPEVLDAAHWRHASTKIKSVYERALTS